ncbi:MAG: UDP-N-acetylmuramoyl-L-alanyl-D-glutamate--2,6-diaminopimelate ligase, partial [Actinomycetia bacterium]|nr:UDP-N-acetylmuramoyl-L-alanyl-D-glutamate--2,6-diaminopimelate ligase [Actinomycetes bacterium]
RESIKTKLAGLFNVYNNLAAFGMAIELGMRSEDIKKGILRINKIKGRFQFLKLGQDFDIVIDYAHTPDGLENVIKAAKEIGSKRVITVFGCGGDRDKKKRPMMGKIAGKGSDEVIITSDNPRTENPEDIIEEIAEGLKNLDVVYKKIIDRREAIKHVLKQAKKGDIVLIAGKGHEDYQIFKDKVISFSDYQVVEEELRKILN